MFEFVCDRVIPGCTYHVTSDTEEGALEEARKHLEDHHGMDYLDEDVAKQAAGAIQRIGVR